MTLLFFPDLFKKINQYQMPQRIIIIYLFFFDHTLCLFVNEHPWLDRYSFDVRRHKWCVSTLPVQKSIGFNSYLYYAHILFYSRSHMNFFKAIQKCVLETRRSQFFFIILSGHVGDCTCIILILFRIILLPLLSS